MPVDVGVALERLTEAMQRQRRVYAALKKSVAELAARFSDDAFPDQDDAQGAADVAVEDILHKQAASVEALEQASAEVRRLNAMVGAALGLDEVTVGAIRTKLLEKGMLAAHQDRIGALEDEVDRVLRAAQETQAIVADNERRLREKIGSVAGHLSGIRTGHDAAQAYGRIAKGAASPPKFLDQER